MVIGIGWSGTLVEIKNTLAKTSIKRMLLRCCFVVPVVCFLLPQAMPVQASQNPSSPTPSILNSSVQAPLVMGVFPRRNAKLTFEMFTSLAKHLSDRLGRPVVLEPSANFKDFWDGVSTLRYDIVHYNQYHYIRSHKKLGYDVIAMNEEFGRTTISGSIDVRRDSSIKSIQDLKGQKIVFGGGPKAMMSYIMPTYLLRLAGLKAGEYQEEFAKSPPNAILSTYFKQSKAAGVGDTVLLLPSVKSKCDTAKLRHLVVGEPIAHLPWAVSGNISVKLRTNIQSVLINMAKASNGQKILKKAKLTGLSIATDEDYNRHRQIIFEVLGERY